MRQCIMQWVLIVELFIFSTNLVAIEIDSVQIDANQQWLELTLLLQHSTISRHSKDEVTLDTRDCESKKPPIRTCKIMVKDRYHDYRYGPYNRVKRRYSLSKLALTPSVYNGVELELLADESSRKITLPTRSVNGAYEHKRLRFVRSYHFERAMNGFAHLAENPFNENMVFGFVTKMVMNEKIMIAYDLESGKLQWSSVLSRYLPMNFILSSALQNVLLTGGRFVQPDSNESNLKLIDALTGSIVREYRGLEDLDVTSAYWRDAQTIVTHSSRTDRVVGENTIADKGILEGIISWHNAETGVMQRRISSPLLQARVIEQSSDQNIVVFAGYEGAAIVNAQTGAVLSSLHFSDIYGPEFKDCYNFGCGPNGYGFSHYTVSADRRIFAVATNSGPVYLGDSESQKIFKKLEVKTPGDTPLFIRTMKIDQVRNKLYIFGAEKFEQPSNGHVLVYNLYDSRLETWYHGGEVLGANGGSQRGNIFINGFQSVLSSDSTLEGVDMRMMTESYLSHYELED